MQTSLYESDFHAWTIQQSELLRLRKLDHLDFENLIEEIISLGKQQQQELRNRLGLIIGHLLKWEYQPEKRTRSWQVTIQLQRQEIHDLLQDNPRLNSYLDKALVQSFRLGLAQVLSETPIKKQVLPNSCPYSLSQLLDPHFPEDIGIEF